MPPLRQSLWRNLTFRSPVSLRQYQQYQRRCARVQDVRSSAFHGNQEKILDRYKDKLDRKAKQEGFESISDLKAVYKEKIESLRKKAIVPGATGPLASAETSSHPSSSGLPFPPPPPPPAQPSSKDSASADTSNNSDPPGVRPLSSYVNVPKVRKLPAEEISNVWRLIHASNQRSLTASIPTSTYSSMIRLARQHPQFILPLPKEGQGAEIHFLQWTFPSENVTSVLFTHLAEYKLRGEYATPHTSITMYSELAEGNGIVLACGEVMERRGVTVDEGRWLFMCLQRFYALQNATKEETGDMRSQKLLRQFSEGDSSFDIQELLDEAERVG